MVLRILFFFIAFSHELGRHIHFTCAAGVRFPSENVAQVDKQRLLLWEAAAFLLSQQIPAAVRIFLLECRT